MMTDYATGIIYGTGCIVKDKENGFSLKSIAVNEKKIDKEKKRRGFALYKI